MKTQSLLWSFALICLGCIASQAQEYEYVPLVQEWNGLISMRMD